jgi:hypothetical protein
MSFSIRPLKTEEVPQAVQFVADHPGWTEANGPIANKSEEYLRRHRDLELFYQGQHFRHRELLVGAFNSPTKKEKTLTGVGLAVGQGDIVAVEHLSTFGKDPGNVLACRILEKLEQGARRYGYVRIFLSGQEIYRELFLNMGYKPQLLFTAETDRRKLLSLLADLYPLWIESNGASVRVLYGSDRLEVSLEKKIRSLPVTTSYLYLKQL